MNPVYHPKLSAYLGSGEQSFPRRAIEIISSRLVYAYAEDQEWDIAPINNGLYFELVDFMPKPRYILPVLAAPFRDNNPSGYWEIPKSTHQLLASENNGQGLASTLAVVFYGLQSVVNLSIDPNVTGVRPNGERRENEAPKYRRQVILARANRVFRGPEEEKSFSYRYLEISPDSLLDNVARLRKFVFGIPSAPWRVTR